MSRALYAITLFTLLEMCYIYYNGVIKDKGPKWLSNSIIAFVVVFLLNVIFYSIFDY